MLTTVVPVGDGIEIPWLYLIYCLILLVGLCNAVNLTDGLDGLAAGTVMVVMLVMAAIAFSHGSLEPALFAGALAGACIGFLWFNSFPADIFMGDTGSTFLGYVLAVISIQGLFKMYTLISFVVPFLLFGLPIFDTCFAFIRRIAHGQSPMHADRGHVHHRLIDMGFSQKQAVAVLYVITAILGLSAVVLTTSGAVKAMLLLVAFCAAGAVALSIFQSAHQPPQKKEPRGEENEEGEGEK